MNQAYRFAEELTQAPPVEQFESDKWELDTTPWLDRIYHGLLGETFDTEERIWKSDPKKQRFMNELGASAFIQEMTRVNIHMQLSDLSDADIREISSWAAQNFSTKMADNFEKWEVEPMRSNLKSIADQLLHNLIISLRIARNGGMKTHRQNVKSPKVMSSVPPPGYFQPNDGGVI